MIRCALVMPPIGAPLAFHTLARSFPAMMIESGLDIDIRLLPIGDRPPELFDAALYAWSPGAEQERPRARRHIEICVDGDIPPSRGVERVYPSEAWRNWMWGKYGQGAFGSVIPNWVDPELWPFVYDAPQKFFLYAGRLWPNKTGILAHLIRALPEERFYIAGEGDREPLRAPNVSFLGHVDQPHLAAIMGQATAVLCPSLYCEPFGLAAVEAELTGALVLASDVGGFHETLSPSSRRLDPFSLEDWIQALREAQQWSALARPQRRRWQERRHAPAVVGPQYAKILAAAPAQFAVAGAHGAIEACLVPVD